MTDEELKTHIAELGAKYDAELKPGLAMILVLYDPNEVEADGEGLLSWVCTRQDQVIKVLKAVVEHCERQN